MNFRRWRVSWSVFPLLLGVLLIEFYPEIYGLGWHLLHGSRITLRADDGRAYIVRVPLFLPASIEEGGQAVIVVRRPGPIRINFGDKRNALLRFSVQPSNRNAADAASSAPLLAREQGVSLSEREPVVSAALSLRCFEQGLPESSVENPISKLECLPPTDRRGFSAQFLGSPALLPEFYAVLRDVQRQPPK